MVRWLWPVLAIVALAPRSADAHSTGFGALVIDQQRGAGHQRLHITLRVEGSEGAPADVRLAWPQSCRAAAPAAARDAAQQELVLECDEDAAPAIGVRGMEGSGLQLHAHATLADGRQRVEILGDGDRTFELHGDTDDGGSVTAFVVVGARHILGGLDHALFVLGLVLLAGGFRGRLVAAITAFTLGHSVTLALAALDLARLPAAPVEACIALSLLYTAHAACRAPSGAAQAPPWPAAAAFGLLHGLGFAGALRDLSLSTEALLPALLGFNLGVELGQLLLVAAFVAVIAIATSRMTRARVIGAAAAGIAIVASFLVIERAVAIATG